MESRKMFVFSGLAIVTMAAVGLWGVFHGPGTAGSASASQTYEVVETFEGSVQPPHAVEADPVDRPDRAASQPDLHLMQEHGGLPVKTVEDELAMHRAWAVFATAANHMLRSGTLEDEEWTAHVADVASTQRPGKLADWGHRSETPRIIEGGEFFRHLAHQNTDEHGEDRVQHPLHSPESRPHDSGDQHGHKAPKHRHASAGHHVQHRHPNNVTHLEVLDHLYLHFRATLTAQHSDHQSSQLHSHDEDQLNPDGDKEPPNDVQHHDEGGGHTIDTPLKNRERIKPLSEGR